MVSKKEEEEDLLGAFFYRIYEFLFTFSDPPPVIHRPHVPVRYAIKIVLAAAVSITPPVLSSVISPSIVPVIVSTDYSVVSSINFVPVASAVPTAYSVVSSANSVPAVTDGSLIPSSSCIGTN